MSTTPNRRAVYVGLFVTVALAILAAGILTIGDISGTFSRKIMVRAVFEEVSGLQTGDNVWCAGLKVGTVARLGFLQPGEVEVEMNIDAAAAPFIHGDSLAKIGSDGLIGNRIVVIHGGTADAAHLEDGSVLETSTSVSTEELLNTLQTNNENLVEITADIKKITAKIAAGEGSVGTLLMDDALLVSASEAVESLKAASDNARSLTASLATFSAKLNKEGSLPNDLVTDKTTMAAIRGTVEQLQHAGEKAATLLDGLSEGASNPATPAGALLHDEEAGADLKSTLSNLDKASDLLAVDLEALQSNFLLRPFFKKKEREAKKAARQAEKGK